MVDEARGHEDQVRDDLREHLARELHDAVAGQLQTLLVEMELLRRSGEAPGEIEHFQVTTRQALSSLRETLYQLRQRSPDSDEIQGQIERKLEGALTAGPSRRRRTEAASA